MCFYLCLYLYLIQRNTPGAMGVEEEALETAEEKERRENIRLVDNTITIITVINITVRLVDEEEDDARLNWELVFNLATAALAVMLVLWLGF